MTNFLRAYHNRIICIPVKQSWSKDIEIYGRWLMANDSSKTEHISSWALTRRICLIAFADYYGQKDKTIQKTFMIEHQRFQKFPTPTDFTIEDRKYKIVASQVNERWNIGPILNCKITEKAAKKGNDVYIAMAYNLDRIYIVGWLYDSMLKQFKDGKHYIMREHKLMPMHEHKPLHERDTRQWYLPQN